MGVANVKEHSLKKRRMNKYDFQQFQMIVKIREPALFTRAMPGFSLVINKINNRMGTGSIKNGTSWVGFKGWS